MSSIEILLVVVLSLILLFWIVLFAGSLFLFWRFRKTIVALTVAVRGLKELTRQIERLGRSVGEINRRVERGQRGDDGGDGG